MKEHGNEEPVFEIGVVIPRRVVQEKDESCDCAYVLVKEFEKVGFVVERVIGIADEFIKVRFFTIPLYILKLLMFHCVSVTFIQFYALQFTISFLLFFILACLGKPQSFFFSF